MNNSQNDELWEYEYDVTVYGTRIHRFNELGHIIVNPNGLFTERAESKVTVQEPKSQFKIVAYTKI